VNITDSPDHAVRRGPCGVLAAWLLEQSGEHRVVIACPAAAFKPPSA
jgi:hypothetical protein